MTRNTISAPHLKSSGHTTHVEYAKVVGMAILFIESYLGGNCSRDPWCQISSGPQNLGVGSVTNTVVPNSPAHRPSSHHHSSGVYALPVCIKPPPSVWLMIPVVHHHILSPSRLEGAVCHKGLVSTLEGGEGVRGLWRGALCVQTGVTQYEETRAGLLLRWVVGGGWVGGSSLPLPPSGAELLEAPKALNKIYSLN